ncbi:CAAX amino terminal protease self- immunity [compost metagenome]
MVGSAAIFGVVHGFNVILFDAFMVGILTGILFRKTGSIWPGVVVHIVYNGLNLLYYSTL